MEESLKKGRKLHN